MADRLMRMSIPLLLFAALAQVAPVLAQSKLADPTRPPAALAVEESGEAPGPVLQSVMIPRKGKPMALIGGQQVVLGSMYGERRLISLTEREAVLKGPAGTEHLYLTPGIEKTYIVAKTPVAKRGQSKGRP